MLEKPSLWKSRDFYEEEKTRTIKLYHKIHWDFCDDKTKTGRKKRSRKLKNYIEKWLLDRNFPHRLVLGGNGRSRVVFERKDHAMLFKLTWS